MRKMRRQSNRPAATAATTRKEGADDVVTGSPVSGEAREVKQTKKNKYF